MLDRACADGCAIGDCVWTCDLATVFFDETDLAIVLFSHSKRRYPRVAFLVANKNATDLCLACLQKN
jgi:hypothetical protein